MGFASYTVEKIVTGMPTSQFRDGIFLGKIPSSKMTSLRHVDIKLASTTMKKLVVISDLY